MVPKEQGIECCCGTMSYCFNQGYIYVDNQWVVMRLDDDKGYDSEGEVIHREEMVLQYCPFCGKEPVSTE
jgi:hypothetical protein